MNIEERVARLEKQNRRLRIGLTAGVCTIVCIVGVAAFPVDGKKPDKNSDVLRARKIVVSKSKKSPGIVLEATDDEAIVSVFGESGKDRLTLTYNKKEQSSRVTLWDEAGNSRATVEYQKGKGTFLLMNDQKGNYANIAVLDKNAVAAVRLHGKAGSCTLAATEKSASLSVSDQTGKTRGRLMYGKGNTSFSVSDETGKTRGSFSYGKGIASVILKGKTGDCMLIADKRSSAFVVKTATKIRVVIGLINNRPVLQPTP